MRLIHGIITLSSNMALNAAKGVAAHAVVWWLKTSNGWGKYELQALEGLDEAD